MNHALGVPGMVIPGGDGGSGKLEGRVTNSDEIRALLSREVVYVLEQLLGDGKFVSPQGAQLALRFPELCTDSWVGGRSWHTDGLRQRKPHPFSLLLGVAISATTQEDCGNLCIWPGSHILTHRWTNWEDGTICTTEFGGDADRLPDLGRPVQICANEGVHLPARTASSMLFFFTSHHGCLFCAGHCYSAPELGARGRTEPVAR